VNWTREKPTQAGAYWLYVDADQYRPARLKLCQVAHYVSNNYESWDVQYPGSDEDDSLHADMGWWLGPLDVPTPPHMIPATEVA
jgi:hypothetical protein